MKMAVGTLLFLLLMGGSPFVAHELPSFIRAVTAVASD